MTVMFRTRLLKEASKYLYTINKRASNKGLVKVHRVHSRRWKDGSVMNRDSSHLLAGLRQTLHSIPAFWQLVFKHYNFSYRRPTNSLFWIDCFKCQYICFYASLVLSSIIKQFFYSAKSIFSSRHQDNIEKNCARYY